MAKKIKTKTKILSGTGATYKGSDSTSVIDVIKVYGTCNTVKARNGNDQITVYKGKNHIIYGGGGTDTITITKKAGTGINVYGDAGNDTIKIDGGKSNKIYGGKGADTITLNAGNKNYIYGGAGNDKITVSGGKSNKIYGEANKDVIRIKGGSGHVIDGGTGNDKIYVDGGSVKSIDNSGGSDYIEIGKKAGNGIKVESGASKSYKLNANETVKVLGGNNHDVRLYGGNDKVIIAGGSGHTVYTDGPTGTGDAGGNDIIVIQDGGKAKRIVAGNGDDVIAVANGAGNGSVIYTGLEDKNVTGIGHNTVNLLGGSGHTVYLNGNSNTIMIESQDVTLNKHHGTVDDITVRWSEQGTGTLRVNCPSPEMGNGGKKSTLRIEGADSTDFSFEFADIKMTNGSDNSYTGKTSLIIKFTGSYTRDTRSVNQVAGTTGTVYYQNPAPNEPNNTQYTCLPVYVNTDGRVQYNWCQGNERFVYDDTPEVTAAEMTAAMGGTPAIEIARWKTYQAFSGIAFDNGTFTFDQITAAANTHSVLI